MKSLRILTGPHAGAQVRLTPDVVRVSADEDADIHLSDWSGADALLEMDDTGAVSITRVVSVDAARDDDIGSVWLTDWVPMQFDEVVICIGPSDSAWPSDVDLLSTLLANPVKQELESLRHAQKRQRKAVTLVSLTLIGCAVVGAALLGTARLSRAAGPGSSPADRALRIQQALAHAHFTSLQTHPVGDTIVVDGLVVTPADDATVRTLLETIAPHGVERRYDIAQLDARGIEDSLGIAGIHVNYIGNGRFAISGEVAAQGELNDAVTRIRADLSSNVKGIVMRTTQSASAGAPEFRKYSEMISSDDVEYAETPDGIKHIFVFDPASGTAAASALPASGTATAPALPASGAATASALPASETATASALPASAAANAPALAASGATSGVATYGANAPSSASTIGLPVGSPP